MCRRLAALSTDIQIRVLACRRETNDDDDALLTFCRRFASVAQEPYSHASAAALIIHTRCSMKVFHPDEATNTHASSRVAKKFAAQVESVQISAEQYAPYTH